MAHQVRPWGQEPHTVNAQLGQVVPAHGVPPICCTGVAAAPQYTHNAQPMSPPQLHKSATHVGVHRS
jgi:hypothetical protein